MQTCRECDDNNTVSRHSHRLSSMDHLTKMHNDLEVFAAYFFVMGVEIQANITHGFEGNASKITRTEALTPSLMKNSSGIYKNEEY